LEIIENQLTTASTAEGILAIDDTGCPKAFAKKTEGAKYQYCGPLKRREVCNVVVASTFGIEYKAFSGGYYAIYAGVMF
ncbi:MAG: transposase, partial [Candidatus Anammoxibacter sp.]